MSKTRVLIADDSAVARRLIERLLNRHPDIEVVGAVSNGAQVLQGAVERSFDALVLDLEMPEFDGAATLRALRELAPDLPVVIFSGAEGEAAKPDPRLTLSAGISTIKKPGNLGGELESVADELPNRILELVNRMRRREERRQGGAPAEPSAPSVKPTSAKPAPESGETSPLPPARPGALPPKMSRDAAPIDLIVIGSSTGGPNALSRVLSQLPGDLSVPVAIVQHIPEGFTEQLAKRLDRESALHVLEAEHGEALVAGQVVIAPGGRHLEVVPQKTGFGLRLNDGPLENSCRPAVDVLFRSAARAAGGRVLGVVLTGMGQDGLVGAKLLRQAGARVLAQDEATSVVWGMPGALVREGECDQVLPLNGIPSAIQRAVAQAGSRGQEGEAA